MRAYPLRARLRTGKEICCTLYAVAPQRSSDLSPAFPLMTPRLRNAAPWGQCSRAATGRRAISPSTAKMIYHLAVGTPLPVNAGAMLIAAMTGLPGALKMSLPFSMPIGHHWGKARCQAASFMQTIFPTM